MPDLETPDESVREVSGNRIQMARILAESAEKKEREQERPSPKLDLEVIRILSGKVPDIRPGTSGSPSPT